MSITNFRLLLVMAFAIAIECGQLILRLLHMILIGFGRLNILLVLWNSDS